MSFTPDELQAFNTILEQKLAQHRRDMERVFEQRLHIVKRDLDQRLNRVQQEMIRTLSQGFGEQNRKLRGMLGELVVSIDEDGADNVSTDEVETEIDFADLSEALNQALGERLQVLGDMQEVLKSIQQLERIVESMQIAMTTNSSLISNRLYHHQQLPLERAHQGQASALFQETLPLKRIQTEEGEKKREGNLNEQR